MILLRSFATLFVIAFIFVLITTSAEAGIISALSKLGKVSHKVDGPDIDLPNSTHFKDIVANLPEGSVAEISIVNGRWVAKSPDGQQRFVDEFIDGINEPNHSATLILSERNIPKSLSQFDTLPSGLAIKILSRNGNIYSLHRNAVPPTLRYRNIKTPVTESTQLGTVIWQLQRPVMNQKVRFVQLSKNADADLPSQVYGSKPVIDAVGLNKIVNAIENMRLETMVLSGKTENGLLHHGGQSIPLKALEKAAAARDVNLIILGSNKPKKALQRVADDWKAVNDSGDNLSDSIGDFYNRFTSEYVNSPMRVGINESGELQTAFHIETKIKPVNKQSTDSSGHLVAVPLHLLIESVKILQPNEDRVKELDRRIHPAIPSSIQFYLIVSFFVGAFTAITSWFLYKKIWQSPVRVTYSNVFSFAFMYVLHRLCFIVLYLPVLGIFSPIYLILKWTVAIIRYLVINPISWLVSRFN